MRHESNRCLLAVFIVSSAKKRICVYPANHTVNSGTREEITGRRVCVRWKSLFKLDVCIQVSIAWSC